MGGRQSLSDGQRRKIWAVTKELGLEEDFLRDVVEKLTGQRHVSGMSKLEAKQLIDLLEQAARDRGLREGRKPKGNRGRRPGRATEAQLWKQRQLAEALGWNEERLLGFVRRMAKVDRLEWQLFEDASKTIEGLKKMLRRQERAGTDQTAVDGHTSGTS